VKFCKREGDRWWCPINRDDLAAGEAVPSCCWPPSRVVLSVWGTAVDDTDISSRFFLLWIFFIFFCCCCSTTTTTAAAAGAAAEEEEEEDMLAQWNE